MLIFSILNFVCFLCNNAVWMSKELIGNFFRQGKVYTQDIINVYDHDFASQADGKNVPHGLYDVNRNVGYITLGE